jgi:Protein of unknown function (DUF1580)
MIDIHCEHTFPFVECPKRIRSRPSPATIYRWALKGVRGVVLETVMMGGRRYTSVEAVDRFFSRLSEPKAKPPATPSNLRAEEIARATKRAETMF